MLRKAMTQELLKKLIELSGTFEGPGKSHDGTPFQGSLRILEDVTGKSVRIEYRAVAEGGKILHHEKSTVGLTFAQKLALWVCSDNHPAVAEHTLIRFQENTDECQWSADFQLGNPDNRAAFREIISMDLHANGDLTYRYAWGMPGGDFADRSYCRMIPGHRRPIAEAKLEQTPQGWVPQGPGWYVLNAKEARWSLNQKFGSTCNFEGSVRFDQYGFNVHVMNPGQPNCHYHGEDDQEDFLVIDGECLLLMEGVERKLKKWDFVHCPKWARHVFIATGNQPCVMVMAGARSGQGIIYPVIPSAQKYNACPDQETPSPAESYKDVPKSTPAPSPL